MAALDRSTFQRVVARLVPGVDVAALDRELRNDKRTPVQVVSETDYLARQTLALGTALAWLARFMSIVMGIAAILGSINTMLASVGARTHEIGVLLSIGFSRAAIFASFLVESALVGLAGGLLGVALVLPFDGMQTGTTNWNTFTDVSFSIEVTPRLMLTACGLAFTLGLIGGVLPALRAASMRPVDAMRHL